MNRISHGVSDCSAERVLYGTARLLLAQTVLDALNGGPKIEVERTCAGCRKDYRKPLPSRVSGALVEAALPGGARGDVGLLIGDRVAMAIEVFVSDAVTPEKGDSFGVPWARLSAAEVIERPWLWRPMIASKIGRCDACQIAHDQREEAVRAAVRATEASRLPSYAQLAPGLGLPADPRPYRAAIIDCWKCHRPTPVFAWNGHEAWGTDQPPDPVPHTVRFAYSKTTGSSYWANHCVHCKVLQGDNWLYQGAETPFTDGREVPGEYRSDTYRMMQRIVRRGNRNNRR